MGGMGWHGHPGAGVGVSLGRGCALDGGTAPGPPQQPPEHRGRSSWDTAPAGIQLQAGLGWPWEWVGEGWVSVGTGLPAPGWGPSQCQAGVGTRSSHGSWCQSCVQPRVGSSSGTEQNPWHQPHPTWALSVHVSLHGDTRVPSSPYTGARTGVGAQGGHFSPQGLVYRPQKESALNSRFRSAPLTSISFRKLELHNYPKPRMN